MMNKNKALLLARAPSAALLLFSLMGFTGCSAVPDEANPVEWYRGVSGWFESDKDQAERDQAKTAKETAPPLPGADKPYPNLSTVPERPRSVSSPEERNRVQQGLAADRANARYTKPDSDRPSGADVGAPVAAPRTPVTVAPSGPSPDTLEALPRDIAPPPMPTSPSSSLEDGSSQPVAEASQPAARESAAIESEAESKSAPIKSAPMEPPVIQRASYQSSSSQLLQKRPPAAAAHAILASASVTDAPPTPAPSQAQTQAQAAAVAMVAMASAVPARASATAEATHSHNDAVAQQATPPAAGAAGGAQVLPRSFMVYFKGGSAKLDGADQAVLNDVARLYKSHGGTLRVVGHASSGTHEKDAYKSQIVNLRVSTQRAEAVAAELARLGVPRSKMAVAGVSDSQPLYQETTQGGIAGNRRVEIFFGP